jgi:serine phosphatase RsbU (regulator of sigma subunit)/HAMP domain-containing protein
MKDFRITVTRKFFIFLLSIGAFIFVAYVGLILNKVLYLSAHWILLGGVIILTVISFFFLIVIGRPLDRITVQVKNLLTGKPYKKVPPTTIDEIGVFTYFFDEVTSNLEKVSRDILEKERMTSEISAVSSIQQDIIPKRMPQLEGLDIIAKNRPVAAVGGDTFDFFERGKNVILYIGDVTGHGVPACVVMMMVNTLIHAYSQNPELTLRDIVIRTNRTLTDRISSSRFMTMLMLQWNSETKKMSYVGAGHEHILIYRHGTRQVESIRSGGVAMCMVPDIEKFVREKEVPLAENDAIMIYSDGITEGKNEKGQMFGLNRLIDSLRINGYKSSSEAIFDSISRDFSAFLGTADQLDDITMIIAKRIPDGQLQKTHIKLVVERRPGSTHEVKHWDWKQNLSQGVDRAIEKGEFPKKSAS